MHHSQQQQQQQQLYSVNWCILKFLCVFKSIFVLFVFTFVFVIVFCMFSRLFPALYVVSYLHLLQLFFSFRWKNDIWLVHYGQVLAITFRNPTWLLPSPSPSPSLLLSSFAAFNIPELPCGAIWSQGLYSPIISFCGTAKLSLNSCILNLLADEHLPFLVRWKWQTNLLTYLAQVFAGVLALITSILYFLAAAFAYKTIKDNMWILNIFTNISIQVLNYTSQN